MHIFKIVIGFLLIVIGTYMALCTTASIIQLIWDYTDRKKK